MRDSDGYLHGLDRDRVLWASELDRVMLASSMFFGIGPSNGAISDVLTMCLGSATENMPQVIVGLGPTLWASNWWDHGHGLWTVEVVMIFSGSVSDSGV